MTRLITELKVLGLKEFVYKSTYIFFKYIHVHKLLFMFQVQCESCHWWQHFQCTTIQKTFNEVNQEDYRFICDICSFKWCTQRVVWDVIIWCAWSSSTRVRYYRHFASVVCKLLHLNFSETTWSIGVWEEYEIYCWIF